MKLVAKPAGRPNGIALSPNGRMLYVMNADEHNVRAYDLDRNGDASNERVLIPEHRRGAGRNQVNDKGDLYVAAPTASRFTAPTGKPLHTIEIARAPSNCAFGGRDARVRSYLTDARSNVLPRSAGTQRSEPTWPLETIAAIPKRPLVGVGAIILKRDRILMAQRGKAAAEGLVVAARRRAGVRRIAGRTPCGARCAKRPASKSGRWACWRFSSASCATRAGAPEYHYVLIDYLCRVTGGELRAGRRRLRRGMDAAARPAATANYRRHARGD